MPHTASAAKKHGADQSDTQKAQQRPKMGRLANDGEKKAPVKRLKDIEITIPIVYGTISFWLGKKASEYQSHKWTVYVRGATNEDLSAVVKRVVFQLLPSFNNPTRVVEWHLLSCLNLDGVNSRLPLLSFFIVMFVISS